MFETLDTSVRLIAIGASLLLLILLVAGRVRRDIKITLIGLLLGAVSYLMNSSETFRAALPDVSLIDLFSIFTPFWIWLFGRRLFEIEPPRWLLWAIAASLAFGWVTGNFVRELQQLGFWINHLVAIAVLIDLIRVSWAGRSDDLIEKRRLIRLWFPILVALQSGGILVFELMFGAPIAIGAVQLANAVLILLLTLFSGLALLQTDPELLAPREAQATDRHAPETLSPAEAVLGEKLKEAMDAGYYRTPGLTIAALADHLDTPEHRLRALINQRLGYRNFSAFLNSHRIAEARRILADKAQVDLPVLTVAMDLGYNSLPTFNRAFRAETSMTPTDYRREKLAS